MFTLWNGRRLLAPAAVLPPHRHFFSDSKMYECKLKAWAFDLAKLMATRGIAVPFGPIPEKLRTTAFFSRCGCGYVFSDASREAIHFLQFLKKCSQTSCLSQACCVKTSGLIVQMSLGTEMGTLVNIIVILVDMCVDTHHWGGTLTTKSCTENLPSQSYL